MTIGGVVLAGGRSTRMGSPKAALDWWGVPLVVHVAASLKAALGGGPVVVVGAPGQPLPALPPGVARTDDPHEGRGPLQGLAAGLAAIGGRAHTAVVAATDQPFVAAAVPPLVAAFRDGDDAVAIRVDERWQPLGALYRTGLHAVAEARLAGGDASLQGLLRDVRTRVLDGTPELQAALRSLDTPEAYAAARGLRP